MLPEDKITAAAECVVCMAAGDVVGLAKAIEGAKIAQLENPSPIAWVRDGVEGSPNTFLRSLDMFPCQAPFAPIWRELGGRAIKPKKGRNKPEKLSDWEELCVRYPWLEEDREWEPEKSRRKPQKKEKLDVIMEEDPIW